MAKSMIFTAVVSDCDGVIADTESVQLHAINTLLHPLGLSLTREEWAMHYVGHPIEEDVRNIKLRFNLDLPIDVLKAERAAAYSRLLENGAGLEPLPGLGLFLDELEARQIPKAIASGSPRRDVETVLRALKLEARFTAIAPSDEVKHSKPAPDVYLLAAARLQVPPEQCLAIEDSAAGLTAAKAAGMQVIAIPTSYTRHQDLSRADAIVNDFHELRRLLFDGREANGTRM